MTDTHTVAFQAGNTVAQAVVSGTSQVHLHNCNQYIGHLVQQLNIKHFPLDQVVEHLTLDKLW